jgi:FdhE protein
MVAGIRSGWNSGSNDAQRRWESRIERARALQGKQQAFAEALRLYEATLECQREIASASRFDFNPKLPLRTQIGIPFACSKMPSILAVALKYGPEALRLRGKSLQAEGEPAWRRLFESALERDESSQNQIEDYFVRACLQPIAENLQSQLAPDRNYSKSICPACGALPQLAVLRPEGEGASRLLLCSFCLREWLFRRIVCPFCGEEDKEKLPRYSAEECDYVHVESCDTCMHYLKAVNMSVEGRAVPLVDEVALAVLDVWAADHGYSKIARNLIGL